MLVEATVRGVWGRSLRMFSESGSTNAFRNLQRLRPFHMNSNLDQIVGIMFFTALVGISP